MAEGGLANIGGRGSRRGPARVRGRDGGQHFAGAPVCLVETRGAGACERAAQLGSERHLASEHERGRDGPMPGGRRVDHGGGLRGLPEAGVGTVASAGAGSSDGQPFFSQRFLGTRAYRRERLRAHVSATLFARSQSHRGSVRQAQGAAAESRGTYPRGAHRGDGPSSRGGDGERCSRLLQAPRLPREGPSAMTDAIGYGSLQTGMAFLPATLVLGALSYSAAAKVVNRFGVKPMLVVGMSLLVASLLLFARAPVGGSYLVDVLPGMVLLGLGASFAFLTVILASVSDVPERDAGLGSGLVNTAQQLGGALGLAVLASFAASRTEGLLEARSGSVAALNGGYHVAFLLSAIFVALATVLAAALLRLSKDGKEVGGKMPTPPSAAGDSGAGLTPDTPADALANDRKTPEERG